MVLVIDNYDSFTYNLVQFLGEMVEVMVARNDELTINDIEEINPDQIVISPGPGRPDGAGISNQIINYFQDKVPILGVCLGHQCIAQVFGGRIIHAENLYHGKTSLIYHTDDSYGIFRGIASPFTATRYHSLIIDPESIPEELKIVATTASNQIMAVVHRVNPVIGLQFHPESILTEKGKSILKNFLNIKRRQDQCLINF